MFTITIGTWVLFFARSRRSALVDVLFIGINVTVGCLLVGFGSGFLERPHCVFGQEWPKINDSMFIVSKTRPSGHGHVIFVGDVGVLFYDHDKRKVRLLRKDDISEICECKASDCPDDCKTVPGSTANASDAAANNCGAATGTKSASGQ